MPLKPALIVAALWLAGCGSETLPDEMHLQAAPAQYTGWVIIRKSLTPKQRMPGYFDNQALDDPEAWVMITGLSWSSVGTRVPVLVKGVDTGYEVELAQVVYGNKIPVLKLAVYHEETERALAYTWAEPGSKRIGINLRWMQAGLTRQPQ